MFGQVTVKDKEGKIKKVISSKKLSNRHWKQFQFDLPQLGVKRQEFIPSLISQYVFEDYDDELYSLQDRLSYE